jgi:hypothetical protein
VSLSQRREGVEVVFVAIVELPACTSMDGGDGLL